MCNSNLDVTHAAAGERCDRWPAITPGLRWFSLSSFSDISEYYELSENLGRRLSWKSRGITIVISSHTTISFTFSAQPMFDALVEWFSVLVML